MSEQRTNEGSVKTENFDITSEEVRDTSAETLAGFQVIIRLTNKHGVGIGGKVYARVGLTEVIEKLMGVLPDQTTTIDFRHATGTITKIYTNDLLCTHASQHVFSFEINNPTNGAVYQGTAT